MAKPYWIKIGKEPWLNVNLDMYLATETSAGLHSQHYGEPATSSFNGVAAGVRVRGHRDFLHRIVRVSITRYDDYTRWDCVDCRYGDGFMSGLVRTLESVEAHVALNHPDGDVRLEIPPEILNSNYLIFRKDSA